VNYYRTHPEEVRALRLDRERVSDLLARYPSVSDGESHEILSFLRNGRHLDIGLLTSNRRLRPKLDAFMADHKAHFRIGIGEGTAVIGGILLILALLWLVWEAFA
jgi:hypothetical protein